MISFFFLKLVDICSIIFLFDYTFDFAAFFCENRLFSKLYRFFIGLIGAVCPFYCSIVYILFFLYGFSAF